jgi:hypothetical protein
MNRFTFITNDPRATKRLYRDLDRQADNPFTDCLFEDDVQYLKFCCNFKFYTSLPPSITDTQITLGDITLKYISPSTTITRLATYTDWVQSKSKKECFFIFADKFSVASAIDKQVFSGIKHGLYIDGEHIVSRTREHFRNFYTIIMPLKINASNAFDIFSKISMPLYNRFLDTQFLEYFFIVCPESDIPAISEEALKYPDIPFRCVSETYFVSKGVLDDAGINGWYKQQIIKLTVANIVETINYLIVDSDMFLNQPFSRDDMFHKGKIKYSSEPWQTFNNDQFSTNSNWWSQSCAILDYPLKSLEGQNHLMGVTPQVVVTEHVLGLLDTIMKEYGNEWQTVLCARKFTEYTLYWLYVKMKSLEHLYTTEGTQLWKHDIHRNILTMDSQERYNTKIKRGMTDRKTYFTVAQSYLENDVDQLVTTIFPPKYDAIFLVASMVSPTVTKHYSIEERYVQTLDTLRSIRDKFTNAFVLVIEGSVLSEEHKKGFFELSDHLLELGNDFDVIQYVTDMRNIGHGEAKLLECGIDYLQKYILVRSSARFIIKLGARYTLTDKFELSNHVVGKYNFFEEFSSDGTSLGVYTTGMYSIPIEKVNEFKNILKNIHKHLSLSTSMIEQYFYDFVPKSDVNTLDTLGLEGNLNYNGYFFSK